MRAVTREGMRPWKEVAIGGMEFGFYPNIQGSHCRDLRGGDVIRCAFCRGHSCFMEAGLDGDRVPAGQPSVSL